MADQSKLTNRHKSLSDKVEDLEIQRKWKRSFEHKTDLINLKKEKLKIKDKILRSESEQLELFSKN